MVGKRMWSVTINGRPPVLTGSRNESKAAAYRVVADLRDNYRRKVGEAHVTTATVWVDEYGDGRWHVYERLDFAEELRSEGESE